MAINRKNDSDVTICRNGVIVNFFDVLLFLLSSLVTGPNFMSISSVLLDFFKGLTRNLEIRNIPVWVLPNTWRLGRVWDTKFGANVSNEMLLNAAKCQGYSFYRFWVIKGKPTWPTQIRVKGLKKKVFFLLMKLSWKCQYSSFRKSLNFVKAIEFDYRIQNFKNKILLVLQDCWCFSRPYPFTFFKGSLPQISLFPFLNTLSQMPV